MGLEKIGFSFQEESVAEGTQWKMLRSAGGAIHHIVATGPAGGALHQFSATVIAPTAPEADSMAKTFLDNLHTTPEEAAATEKKRAREAKAAAKAAK
jgi:hypothetical protein